MRYYTGQPAVVAGREVLLARTGYTGEDGFELFTSPGDAEPVWMALTGRAKRTGWCPPGSPPAIRSGSRPACRCTATSWARR